MLRLHRRAAPPADCARLGYTATPSAALCAPTVIPSADHARHDPRHWRPSTGLRAYLRERRNAREQNGQYLLAELRTQGYTGSSSPLYTLLAHWHGGRRRRGRYRRQAAPAPLRRFTHLPRQTAWLLIQPEKEREPDECLFLDALLEPGAPLTRVAALVATFFELGRRRQESGLEAWL